MRKGNVINGLGSYYKQKLKQPSRFVSLNVSWINWNSRSFVEITFDS